MIKKKRLEVVRGGIAIPLSNKANYYYMSGRKHINGGIDLGRNPRTGLEVEDGEVVKVGKNDIKVYSSVPFLNGKSPAERVMNGDNANKVFNAQEYFKDKNGLNDDGTNTKKLGGNISGLYSITSNGETKLRPFPSTGSLTQNRHKATLGTADDKYDNVIFKTKTDLLPAEEKEFQKWYAKVAAYKGLNKNPDAEGQDYDYRGFWRNENHNKIFTNDKDNHFSDKYKRPNHPTFSNQSIYSNSRTPVGEWIDYKETSLFKHNNFIAKHTDRTDKYLNGTGEGYIIGNNTIIPNRKKFGGRKKAVLGIDDNDDESYTVSSKYKRLYDKFNVKALNRKFDKDYFNLLDKLKANKNLTVADIYNGGEGTDDVKIREILGSDSTYDDIFDTDKENDLYDYYTTTYPNMNPITNNNSNINTNNNSVINNSDNIYTNGLYNNLDNIDNNVITKNGKTLGELIVNAPAQKKSVKLTTDEKVDKNNGKNRLFNSIIGGFAGDAIGLASNIGGNVASGIINNRMLNKLKAPSRPVSQTANKLRTNYNINPQLDSLRETAARYEDAVNNNTTSSRVALARNQQNRFATALNTNNLYGTKENEETKLINADRLNQQEVANKNVAAYNSWRNNVTNFRNTIAEKKAENAVAVTQGISGAISDTVGNVQNRLKDEKTILANALAHPNLPIEQFYKMGLITKKTMNSYREANPIKG